MNRLVVFRILILLFFVIMSTRLWTLQIKQNAVLTEQAQQYTTHTISSRPLRGEILASDGQTRLAESLPAYTIAIRPDQLPRTSKPWERQQVFARLTDMLHLPSAMVLSPTEELRYREELRTGVEAIGGILPPTVFATPNFTVTVPISQALTALDLTHRFSDTLTFLSPVEMRLKSLGGAPYEMVPMTTTRSLDLALMIKENSTFLPGVSVERDYQRAYPHSGDVQSLSHLLGYIGEIDVCDVMRRNPPRSYAGAYGPEWLAKCGITPSDLPGDDQSVRYLLSDRIGRAGLERTFEDDLRGKLGTQQVDVDVNGRLVAEPKVITPTVHGSNLVLTIDYNLQKKTEEVIRKWIAEAERRRRNPPAKQAFHLDYNPIEAGVAIVMNVHTGDILAMVSWPAFDNNIFNGRVTQDEVDRLFNPKPPHPAPAINQAIGAVFPPGSTWKQFSGSTILQGGAITANSTVRDKGELYVKNQYYDADPRYDQRFPNSIVTDRGWINIRTALQFSVNNFFQSVLGGTKHVRNMTPIEQRDAFDADGEKAAAMAKQYGFGQPTGIDLPYEQDGTVPSKSWKANLPEGNTNRTAPWSTGDVYNMAIGQGFVLSTPLQLTAASAAVANDGTLLKPQLVKRVVDDNGKTIREVQPEVRNHVPVDHANLQTLREGMRLAITDGFDTCARKDISGLDIAGKTGTAEYTEPIDPTKPNFGDNARKRSHAWFAGFAPYDKPEIEVLTLVEGAGDMSDGSATITVPAVTEIMQSYFHVTPPPASFGPVKPYMLPCH